MSYRGKGLLSAAALAGAAYWASKQPGGIQGTWSRLQQGAKDIAGGQDPKEVGRRFLRGEDSHMSSNYHEREEYSPEMVRADQVSSGSAW